VLTNFYKPKNEKEARRYDLVLLNVIKVDKVAKIKFFSLFLLLNLINYF